MARPRALVFAMLLGSACSSGPERAPAPTPTPGPTPTRLQAAVAARLAEVLPIVTGELALDAGQLPAVRERLEQTLSRVFQLTIVPISSQRARALLIRESLDQFERDLLVRLRDDQMPLWEKARPKIRAEISKVDLRGTAAPTPAPPR